MESVKKQPRLFINSAMESVQELTFCGGSVAVFSDRCPTYNGINGDSIALIELDNGSGAIVLADGAGGTPGGNKASGTVVERLAEGLTSKEDRRESLRERILDGFEKSNQELIERASGAATTLFVVELQEMTVRPYHVGDSMILIVGNRGKRKLQTISHSPTGYAVEAGVMEEAEALRAESNFVVSNLVGSADMRIEIGGTLDLSPNDTVLVASDGLTDNLTTEEISEIIRKGPLKKAADTLTRTARARMLGEDKAPYRKPDDLSFVLYRARKR